MAESVLDPLEQFAEQLTCSICLEQYKEPKGLPCQHCFCKKCLGRTAQELPYGKYVLNCPSCRKTVQLPGGGVSALPPAFAINKFLELHRLMVSKGYSVLCTEHKQPLDIYCYTCKQAICHKCIYRRHREHKHDLIDDVFEPVKEQILACQELVRQKRATVADCSQAIAAREREIRQQGEAIKQKIHLQNQKIKTVLDTVQEQLMKEIDSTVEEKLCALSIQDDECKCTLTILKSCEDFVDQSLKFGSPQQVITSKEELLKKMKDALSCVDTTIFQPAEAADIGFSESKLPVNYELFGTLQHSHLREKFHVLEESFKKTQCFRTESITVAVRDANGSPIPVSPSLISCQLIASSNPQPLECTIKEASQSTYKISYTPITIGPHQLSVMVGNRNIQGSPFKLCVSSVPPEKKEQAVYIITGLNKPDSMAVSRSGKIAVYESGFDCITVMNREGRKQQSFNCCSPGQLIPTIEDLAFTADEHIVVTDSSNNCIQLFTMNGQCINSAETPEEPGVLTIHPNGQIFVACYGENCIAVFSPDLIFLYSFVQYGLEPGQLQSLFGITTNTQGNIYVTDPLAAEIQVYSSTGEYLQRFSTELIPFVAYITSDCRDNMYVSVLGDCRVYIFSQSGELIHSFNHGVGSCRVLVVDSDGNLYRSDPENNRIMIF